MYGIDRGIIELINWLIRFQPIKSIQPNKREIEGKELPSAKKVKDSHGKENTTTKTPRIEVKSLVKSRSEKEEGEELEEPDRRPTRDRLKRLALKRQKEDIQMEKNLASDELKFRTYGQALQMKGNGSFTKICQKKFMDAMTYLRASEDRKETPFDLTYQTRWNETDLPPDSFACRAFLVGLSMVDAMLENPFVLGKYHLQDDETLKTLQGLNQISPHSLLEVKKHFSTPPKVVISVIQPDNENTTPFASYDQTTGIITISNTVWIPYVLRF
jgi:hypothetical protein